MKIKDLLIAAFVMGALAACTEEGTYPVTGEECTADDPVLQMDAECPDLGGTGTF